MLREHHQLACQHLALRKQIERLERLALKLDVECAEAARSCELGEVLPRTTIVRMGVALNTFQDLFLNLRRNAAKARVEEQRDEARRRIRFVLKLRFAAGS